jgi:thioredoxin-related protein
MVVAVFLLAAAGPAGAAAPGKMSGGEAYSLPSWFKPSFLDFRSDVQEARKQGRHVMVFLHLDECPYCARMLRENFVKGDNHDFMRKHFDVVAVNVRGSLEATWIDGTTHTERSLARHLGVFGTPTLVFLGIEGTKALQLSGYRDPRALRDALEYVQGRHYRSQEFTAFTATRDKPTVYALKAHPQFSAATDFKDYKKPLALLFEDRRCAACARFHEKTLNHPDVVAEMKRFLFVRLDADSSQPVVDLAGKAMTPGQWAKALGLSSRPAVVLFNEGSEISRIDGQLYHFHFKETLRYVSGGHYQRYGTLSTYLAARRQELLKQGISIDYGE